MNELAEAVSDRHLGRTIKKCGRGDLLLSEMEQQQEIARGGAVRRQRERG
ncbi:hypothetical protein [Streptomyces californicus]